MQTKRTARDRQFLKREREKRGLSSTPKARAREKERERERRIDLTEQTTTMMMMMRRKKKRKKEEKRTRNCPSPVVFHRFASRSKDVVVVSSVVIVVVFLFVFLFVSFSNKVGVLWCRSLSQSVLSREERKKVNDILFPTRRKRKRYVFKETRLRP